MFHTLCGLNYWLDEHLAASRSRGFADAEHDFLNLTPSRKPLTDNSLLLPEDSHSARIPSQTITACGRPSGYYKSWKCPHLLLSFSIPHRPHKLYLHLHLHLKLQLYSTSITALRPTNLETIKIQCLMGHFRVLLPPTGRRATGAFRDCLLAIGAFQVLLPATGNIQDFLPATEGIRGHLSATDGSRDLLPNSQIPFKMAEPLHQVRAWD